MLVFSTFQGHNVVDTDNITSLYVTWSPPQPTSLHPLFLRYEILTTHTLTNITFTSGTLLPSSTPCVVEGLNTSSKYLVRVSSLPPLGTGRGGVCFSCLPCLQQALKCKTLGASIFCVLHMLMHVHHTSRVPHLEFLEFHSFKNILCGEATDLQYHLGSEMYIALPNPTVAFTET